MSNVIGFPKPSEYILQCDCGNKRFYVHEDGRVECPTCESVIVSVVARWIVEVPKDG